MIRCLGLVIMKEKEHTAFYESFYQNHKEYVDNLESKCIGLEGRLKEQEDKVKHER